MKIRANATAKFANLSDDREVSGSAYRAVLANKWTEKKKSLAVPINSDTEAGSGVSRGPISRDYESMGNLCAYRYFERLFWPALRRYRLSFRRVGSECAGFAQRSVKWGHDHASCRNFYLDNRGNNFQSDRNSRRWKWAHHRPEPVKRSRWNGQQDVYHASRIEHFGW